MLSSLRFKATLTQIIHAAYLILCFPVLVNFAYAVKAVVCLPKIAQRWILRERRLRIL